MSTFVIATDNSIRQTHNARYITFPSLTTSERNALIGVTNGTIIYNSDINELEVYRNGSWSISTTDRKPIALITSNYTATISDYTLLVDSTSGNITITLPTASSAYDSGKGLILNIKKIDTSLNDVIIQGNGAELIDGSNTQTITAEYEAITVQSNGTQWFII